MAERAQPTLVSVASRLGVPTESSWNRVDVTGARIDSTLVQPGDVFIARPGAARHGAEFATAAIAMGAVAVVTDAAGSQIAGDLAVPVLVVEDVAGAVGVVAAHVHGEPAGELTTVGVTGTNGKTTTTWLIESGWTASGGSAGLIGTLGVHLSESGRREELVSARTTPEATELHELLARMRDRGIGRVAMEVSSHALALGRVAGLEFELAVFLNLTQDHLDFHGDLQSYFAAKASLFEPGQSRRALINVGDPWGRRLARSAGVPVVTFDVAEGADWWADEITPEASGGSWFVVHSPDGDKARVNLLLPGRFQIVNALAAVAALVETGLDLDTAVAGVSACAGVPGRMERVPAEFLAVVDYAHTPAAIERVLAAARELVPGRLLVVVGAGGDRDAGKRELMGAAAAAAEVVIVTDDNPRSEDPALIRAAVRTGAERAGAQVREIADRRSAIAEAVAMAEPADAVLVLGKGAETGQEQGGRVLPFDDRVELRTAIEGRRR